MWRLFCNTFKKNTKFIRRSSRPVDKSTGILCDQIVVPKGKQSRKHYPGLLRRIVFYDAEKGKRLVFATNNMDLPALSIALLYKSRWQVELFFKWIKQHLRIKSFFGYTENAVRCQIWIAVSVYLLVAIIKRELRLERSIYEILQILSVTPFEKTPIITLLEKPQEPKNNPEVTKPRFLWD